MMRLAPVLAAGIACVLLAACGARLSDLPEPAPDADRVHVDLDRVAAEADSALQFAEARRAVLALYDAIARSDHDAIWEALSFETRALLDSVSGGDGRGALERGQLVADERIYAFDVTSLLVLPSLRTIEDETAGEAERESARRKELDLVDSDGARRRVIVIREGDQWRLHLPRIPMDRLQPIPGSG